MARDILEIKHMFSAHRIAKEIAVNVAHEANTIFELYEPVEISFDRWFYLTMQSQNLPKDADGNPDFTKIPGATDLEAEALHFALNLNKCYGQATKCNIYSAAKALFNDQLKRDKDAGLRVAAKPFKTADSFRKAFERLWDEKIFK